MTQKTILTSFILVLAANVRAQTEPSLAQFVSKAIAASPTVAARQHQVREAEAMARSLGSPKNLELDVAPGVGFTNSNFVLGQSFDFSGTRAARAQRARAEVQVAHAILRKAQLAVGSEFLSAYLNYLAGQRNEANAASGVEVARATVEGIKTRIEIGEAPAVQLTRAEVELNRAEQALTLAQSDVATSRAAVNSLLGQPSITDVPLAVWSPVSDVNALSQSALARRPEALEALAHIEVAKAGELEARRAGLPSLFAGVAADTWRLDRRPFQRDNVGLQVRLTMPLFDRGENRFAVRSAEAGRKGREAELKDAERRINLDIETVTSQLNAAREVAKSYEAGIVPKAEQMVKAMQSGLESGLTSFLEVLEAQKTLSQLRREASDAMRNLHLAEVRFLIATALLPGLETPKP
ncbi:MAG: TolC family protein [Fimbriimonadales bacterium]